MESHRIFINQNFQYVWKITFHSSDKKYQMRFKRVKTISNCTVIISVYTLKCLVIVKMVHLIIYTLSYFYFKFCFSIVYKIMSHWNLFLVLFVGQYSGVTNSFVLREHSWQSLSTRRLLWNQIWVRQMRDTHSFYVDTFLAVSLLYRDYYFKWK